jgi:hypothetical protein
MMSNAYMIANACHMYAMENGQFPPRLEDLAGKYLASAELLTLPHDPPGTVSFAYIQGQKPTDDGRNLLFYGRTPEGVLRTTAFIDGHAESLPPDEFKRRLRETYERLKRADEMPAEFRE